ncbi:MAG: O-methyltransferase [bacterium]
MDKKANQYIKNFLKHENNFLESLEESNKLRNDVQPNIELEALKLLVFIIKIKNVKTVLELGTGTGYSAISIASCLFENGGKITTVENHDRMFTEASQNIKNSGFSNTIEIIHEKIEVVLPQLIRKKEQFDLIFQDSGKYLYPLMVENCVKLCKKGGIIVADDTLFKVNKNVRNGLGNYTDSYNKAVFSHKELFSIILPIGDGLTLSYKK